MENATKGLLIAGGVLIAIIILSIAVYLYSLFSNQASNYKAVISNTEIQNFNSKFEVYIGETDITPQEVISLWDLAKEYGNIIKIEVKNKSGNPITIDNAETFLKDYFNNTFECNIHDIHYDNDEKIDKISFKEN